MYHITRIDSTLAEFDLVALEKFLKEIRKDCQPPLVFSHSDFNRGNRIVTKRTDKNGNIVSRIQLVDFDYSTTNYRGTDIGRFFSSYKHTDDNFGNEPFPTDEEMKLFLEEYRTECVSIMGDSYDKDPINSIEQMIKEAKIYALVGIFVDFWFCLLMYCRQYNTDKKFYFLVCFETCFSDLIIIYQLTNILFISYRMVPRIVTSCLRPWLNSARKKESFRRISHGWPNLIKFLYPMFFTLLEFSLINCFIFLIW